MKRSLIVFSMALSLALASQVQAKTSDPKVDAAAAVSSNIVEINTKVVEINYDKRLLTLEGPSAGNNVTIKVSPKVTNLKEIKKGDLVSVKYNESLALMLKKKTKKEATSKTVSDSTTVTNAGDKKPAYSENETIDIVATITNIDDKKPSVTLKGPEGNTLTLAVADKKNLEGIKVGDQVDLTYTDSLAVAVEKAKKK